MEQVGEFQYGRSGNKDVGRDMKNGSKISSCVSEITDQYFDKIFEIVQNVAITVIEYFRSSKNVDEYFWKKSLDCFEQGTGQG